MVTCENANVPSIHIKPQSKVKKCANVAANPLEHLLLCERVYLLGTVAFQSVLFE